MKLNSWKRKLNWLHPRRHGHTFIWVIMKIWEKFILYYIYLKKINQLYLRVYNILFLILLVFMLARIHIVEDSKENYRNGLLNMVKEHLLMWWRKDMKMHFQISDIYKSIKNSFGIKRKIKSLRLQKK